MKQLPRYDYACCQCVKFITEIRQCSYNITNLRLETRLAHIALINVFCLDSDQVCTCEFTMLLR